MKNLYFDGRIVSRLFLLITFLCFMFSVFGSVFFVGNLIASDRDFNVQFKKLDSGEWAFVSETGQMYKPKCLKTACVNRKTDYGCRNGQSEGTLAGDCWNEGAVVKCPVNIRHDNGCSDQNYTRTEVLTPENNCSASGHRREVFYFYVVWAECKWEGSYRCWAEKYIYNDTCLQTDCVEWEVDEIEILKMMPFVGTASVDPNFIEY